MNLFIVPPKIENPYPLFNFVQTCFGSYPTENTEYDAFEKGVAAALSCPLSNEEIDEIFCAYRYITLHWGDVCRQWYEYDFSKYLDALISIMPLKGLSQEQVRELARMKNTLTISSEQTCTGEFNLKESK